MVPSRRPSTASKGAAGPLAPIARKELSPYLINCVDNRVGAVVKVSETVREWDCLGLFGGMSVSSGMFRRLDLLKGAFVSYPIKDSIHLSMPITTTDGPIVLARPEFPEYLPPVCCSAASAVSAAALQTPSWLLLISATWAISHKAWNRLMHALHGNGTSSRSQSASARRAAPRGEASAPAPATAAAQDEQAEGLRRLAAQRIGRLLQARLMAAAAAAVVRGAVRACRPRRGPIGARARRTARRRAASRS